MRPLRAKLKIGSKDWSWELSFWSLAVSVVLSLTVLIFSLFVATVPRGCINPFEADVDDCDSLDEMAAQWAPRSINVNLRTMNVFVLTALLFEEIQDEDSYETSSPVFTRNIVVTDEDRMGLQKLIAESKDTDWEEDFKTRLAPLLVEDGENWGGSVNGDSWKSQLRKFSLDPLSIGMLQTK